MITLQAIWDNTELAVTEIEDMDNIDIGIQDILDQLEGTPYQEIIDQIEIRIHN